MQGIQSTGWRTTRIRSSATGRRRPRRRYAVFCGLTLSCIRPRCSSPPASNTSVPEIETLTYAADADADADGTTTTAATGTTPSTTTPSGGGLTIADVLALFYEWVQIGNTDLVPDSKLPLASQSDVDSGMGTQPYLWNPTQLTDFITQHTPGAGSAGITRDQALNLIADFRKSVEPLGTYPYAGAGQPFVCQHSQNFADTNRRTNRWACRQPNHDNGALRFQRYGHGRPLATVRRLEHLAACEERGG